MHSIKATVNSLERTTLKRGYTDLRGRAASLVGLIYGEQLEIPVYSALRTAVCPSP
jgi:hypothetical protein